MTKEQILSKGLYGVFLFSSINFFATVLFPFFLIGWVMSKLRRTLC